MADSHTVARRESARLKADSASTMVSELISRMNELTDVNGMSYTSWGLTVPSGARLR